MGLSWHVLVTHTWLTHTLGQPQSHTLHTIITTETRIFILSVINNRDTFHSLLFIAKSSLGQIIISLLLLLDRRVAVHGVVVAVCVCMQG